MASKMESNKEDENESPGKGAKTHTFNYTPRYFKKGSS